MAEADAHPDEDARVWEGQVATGRAAEHEAFVQWLNTGEAHELFRRRRLTEYLLTQQDDALSVTFRAPRTGDPRIMIDFLRYPGLWPEFWEFRAGGRVNPEQRVPQGQVRVHWRPTGKSAPPGASEP